MGSGLFNPFDVPPTGAPPPALDVPPANQYSPTTDLDATLAHFQINKTAWASALKDLSSVEQDVEKVLGIIWTVLSDLFLAFISGEGAVQHAYEADIVDLMQRALKNEMPQATELAANIATILGQYITGSPKSGAGSAPGGIGDISSAMMATIVDRLGLFVDPIPPSQNDAGIINAQYLLQQGVQLNLSMWAINHLSHLPGLGWLKHIGDFDNVIFQMVNPPNMVRMMMDAMYTQLVRLPLTRDLNRRFPVKDLGIAAMAKLYMRGSITSQQYQDKLLDSGLDATQAEQLLIETWKPLSVADVGTLVMHKYMTEADALTYLQQIGLMPPYDQLTLTLETHREVFARQRSVGNSLISAYHKGAFDFPTLTTLLTELDFNDAEIAVVGVEHTTNALKLPKVKDPGTVTLTFTDVKELFARSLVDLDFVINYLTNEGYDAQDMQYLILLFFTSSAQIAVNQATLAARERVQAQSALVRAAATEKKNEDALAAALKAEAAQLNANANLFGTPIAPSGIQIA